MKTKGIISDMDGVILDTEKLYVRFWREAAKFYGFEMTLNHALGIRSLSGKLAEGKLQGWFGKAFSYEAVRQKRIELMDEFVEQNGIEPKPSTRSPLWMTPMIFSLCRRLLMRSARVMKFCGLK